MPPFKTDLTGKIFGKLYVRKYAGKGSDGFSLWECRCYNDGCYKVLNVRAQSLVRGQSHTCGCSNITHGLTRGLKGSEKPPEYKSWSHAKHRCSDPNCPAFKDYGGRGLVVCDGWKNDYAAFYKALGKKPEKTSLERNDNDIGYTCGQCDQCIEKGWPMNCRWATSKEQARNRRSSVFVEHEGKRQTLAEWADELGVDLKRLWNRLFRYKMPTALALNRILLTGANKPCELTRVEAGIGLPLGAGESSKA